jgi:hypothetical protein
MFDLSGRDITNTGFKGLEGQQNILQQAVTSSNRLGQTGADCNILQQAVTNCNRLGQTGADCNILQQAVTNCNRLQQTSLRVEVRDQKAILMMKRKMPRSC